MGLANQDKIGETRATSCVSTPDTTTVGRTASSCAARQAGDSSVPAEFSWDPSGSVPRLIDIVAVCAILALKKSAVYALVATGALAPPCKLGKSRRAAARWLLSDVVNFVNTLAAQRPSRTNVAKANTSKKCCLEASKTEPKQLSRAPRMEPTPRSSSSGGRP